MWRPPAAPKVFRDHGLVGGPNIGRVVSGGQGGPQVHDHSIQLVVVLARTTTALDLPRSRLLVLENNMVTARFLIGS